MTYYHQHIIEIRKALYPNEYLYRQAVLAKLFIDKHYNHDINLDEISDKAFFSKFHFIRLFRSIYYKTPYQYLTSVRIEKAKLFLQSGKSISETCSLIGFRSITSFTSLFRKATGYTPANFVKKYRKLPELIPFPYNSLGYLQKNQSQKTAILKKTNSRVCSLNQ
ncbi:MAG TPA: AraC family transcriptional regulator [Chitinophagaceae bacterium]